MPFQVSEELQTEDALNGFRGVTDEECPEWFQRNYRRRISLRFQRSYRWRMPVMLSEELQMKNALNAFRSYRRRMSFQVSEELQMEGALSGFRGVTDGECP
jgi:hypothetical protein